MVNTQRIFSKNATFQKFEVLKTNRNKRHKYKEFFVEGVRNINAAIANGWEIVSFIYTFETGLSNWATGVLENVRTTVNYELPVLLSQELSGKSETSELMAVVRMKEEGAFSLSKNPLLVLFDRPSNKGNLGTLLRSCDALGIEGLIVTGHAVDIYEPDVLASSMGSFFKVPFIQLSNNDDIDGYIKSLKSKYPNMKAVGTTAHKETSIYSVDMAGPILFMVGNETVGLNKHLIEISDILATIPMSENSSASSFNVSCAATVMFYEAVRQRSLSVAK